MTVQIKCRACGGKGFVFELLMVDLYGASVLRELCVKCRQCDGRGAIEGEPADA
jgi:DnaJ-class molecular chaperone